MLEDVDALGERHFAMHEYDVRRYHCGGLRRVEHDGRPPTRPAARAVDAAQRQAVYQHWR